MLLDIKGYRVLATASLPAMADPRDLIDTTKSTSLATTGKAEDEKDGWEIAQEALRARALVNSDFIIVMPAANFFVDWNFCCYKRVGGLINLAPHSIRIEDQDEQIALVSDAQVK